MAVDQKTFFFFLQKKLQDEVPKLFGSSK